MMNKRHFKCGVLSVLLALAAFNGFAVNKQIDVAYGPSDSQKLDVWWDAKNTNAPIIFLVHGGGWKSGDKKAYSSEILAKMITDLGCVLVSPNYRLMGSAEAPSEFQVVQDVWVALAWFREHAGEYGADKNAIITGGSSAGSHLSAALAYGKNQAWLEGTPYAGQEKEILASVKGWYGDSCVADFSVKEGSLPKLPYVSVLSGIFNPIEQTGPGAPPALCVNGDSDQTTPLSGVLNFQKKMESVGSKCTVLVIPGGKHMAGTRMIFKEFEQAGKDMPDGTKTKAAYDEMRAKVLNNLTKFITEQVGKKPVN